MIKVVADKYIKAEKLEEFILLAKQLVKDTKENDAGCISYELLQDIKNPQHVTILEEWESQEALVNHSAAKHFKEATGRFAEFVEKPGEVNLFVKLA